MDLRRRYLAVFVAVVALGVLPAPARPVTPVANSRAAQPAGVQEVDRTMTTDVSRRIDINNINMWVTNFGSFAYDLSTGNAGLEFPRGSGLTAVFASGLWLGATVNGEVRTVVAEYSQEYGPGNITSPSTWANPSGQAFKTWKVLKWSGNPQDTAHADRAASDLGRDVRLDPLAHNSWSEYMKNAAPYGAPWKLYRLDDTSTPAVGDSVDVPGPDVLGDQMLWAVYNDLDPSNHTNAAGRSNPLGVEIQQTTFGFNRQGALGNTLFLSYKFINKGPNQLDNMYVSLWADPDLGGFTDDLVGCDTTLSLGFTYNATNSDQLYGITPPALGYDFFKGPTVGAQTLGLTSFNKYINGTDPSSRNQTYNYMKGLRPDGAALIDPTTGAPTKFFHPGDPVTRTGWLDPTGADKRMMLSAGPFSMAPGETQTVVGAIIIGRGSDRLSSITALKFFDKSAQDAFDRNFVLPSAPPQPVVKTSVDQGQVELCWGTDSQNYSQPGYVFEGYNVYQGASQSGPWTRIATFDKIDGVKTISDSVFVESIGQIVPNYPVAFGADNGLSQCLSVTQDAVRGGPLRQGTEYFFAVTSYSYATVKPPNQPEVLENPQQVIRVIPLRPALGTDLSTASSAVDYFQFDTSQRPTTTSVDPQVVTPADVTGHIYKVVFNKLVPPCFTCQVGSDTATVSYAWSLIDSTNSNQVLLSNQLNQRGDDDYRVVDGLWVKVSGLYFPQLQAAAYLNNVTDDRRAITAGNGWSGNDNWFFQGAGYGRDFFQKAEGTTVPSSTISASAPGADSIFATVNLNFDSTAPQKAYRFLRHEVIGTGAAPPGGRKFAYGGFFDVPFSVFDETTGNQLEVAFVERVKTDPAGTILAPAFQPATFDSTWGPDIAADSLGAREYVFVIHRGYSGVEDPFIGGNFGNGDGKLFATASNAAVLPVEYALWPGLRDSSDVIDNGDGFRFTWAVPATNNDLFVINTGKLVRNNKAIAKNKLDLIRAVPNPYYNMSRYELNQFNRVVRFMNLPEQCTIRIFNLGGSLVRTLHKTDITSSALDWNLQTESRLPVASGIYIFHVDAPGVGSKVGRMVVFMEKERLNNF
jgi:hypothetical protein